jgi:uncharacterized protein YyaL (SSP411 family)
MSGPTRHPHFVSPLSWYRNLPEALDAAREQKRAVFVQVGRQSCGGCRAIVEKTVAKEEIREYLDAHYVCVAADADSLAPDVAELVSKMPQHERTPFCLYVGPDGKLLHSTSGGRPPAVFLADLIEAQHRLPVSA